MTTSIAELLEHFRDDVHLQPLFQQLDTLSERVKDAAQQNAGDPRALGASLRPSSPWSTRAREQQGGGLLSPRGSRSMGRQGSEQTRAAKLRAAAMARAGSRPSRAEDALLPIPPEPGQPLPPFEGTHDWEALQGPVNDACAHFSSPTAKVTWKKWALTPSNVSVVVAVAWWTVAHVFRPDHPLSAAVQEHAFRFFSARYAHDVLTWGGSSKDLYQDLWLGVVAAASVVLLREAFPRSQHKLDPGLVAFVTAQLTRWTAGALPADLHPSGHAIVGESTPAAVTHYARQLTAAEAALKAEHTARAAGQGAAGATSGGTGAAAGVQGPGSTLPLQTARGGAALGGTTGQHAGSSSSHPHPLVPHLDMAALGLGNAYSGAAGRTGSFLGLAGNGGDGEGDTGSTGVVPGAGHSAVASVASGATASRTLLALAHMSVEGAGNLQDSSGMPAGMRAASSPAALAGSHLSEDHQLAGHTYFSVGPAPLSSMSIQQHQVKSAQADSQSQGAAKEAGTHNKGIGVGPHQAHAQQEHSAAWSHAQQYTTTSGLTQEDSRYSTGGRTSTGAGSPTRLTTRGFAMQRTSPIMGHLFESHDLGRPGHHTSPTLAHISHGLLGTAQPALRPPLDYQRGTEGSNGNAGNDLVTGPAPASLEAAAATGGAAAVAGEGFAQELSYKAMAQASRQRAADAVAKYEASKKAAAREVAAIRRQWVGARSDLESKVAELAGSGGRYRDMSDRLSGWVENDIDRLLKDQPVATRQHTKKERRRQAPSVAAAPSALHQGQDSAGGDGVGSRTGPPASEQQQGVAADVQKVSVPEHSRGAGPRRRLPPPTSATEAVLRVGGGASMGAALGIARDVQGSQGAAVAGGVHYMAMTTAAVASANRPSAGFLAATAATAAVSGGGVTATRIMQPWSKMRAVEIHIRGALSQARHGSNDLAARAAHLQKAELDRDSVPGMLGNGMKGKDWRPSPLKYTRGTFDIRIKQEARKLMRLMDPELYNS